MIKYCWDVNIWSRIVEQVYIYIYIYIYGKRERKRLARTLNKFITSFSQARFQPP